VCPGVPKRDGSVQTGTDGLQVRSRLWPFIPTTLKQLPQFVNKSDVCRRLWPVWSKSFQYRIVDLLSIKEVVWITSAQYLLARKTTTKPGRGCSHERTS